MKTEGMTEVKKKKWYRNWKVWAGIFGALFIIGLFTPDEEVAEPDEAEKVTATAEDKAAEKIEKEEAVAKKKAQQEAEKAEATRVAEARRAEVNAALFKIAEVSEGTLSNVYVTPYAPEGILTQISADVSDAWYHSQDFEKERFAEVVYGAIKATLVEVGAIENRDETIIVTLYDGHGKELAKSKMFGGFKIKR